MPLSGAEQAAWAGVLSARRGGKALPPAVQTALVAFFAENDLSVAEYWPVDINDVDCSPTCARPRTGLAWQARRGKHGVQRVSQGFGLNRAASE